LGSVELIGIFQNKDVLLNISPQLILGSTKKSTKSGIHHLYLNIKSLDDFKFDPDSGIKNKFVHGVRVGKLMAMGIITWRVGNSL